MTKAPEGVVEILLVEDSPTDVELALHALERNHVTNRIHVVRDGAEALEFIFATGEYAGRDIRNGPKVILLDLKLPKVHGLEVLRRIKGDPRTHDISVVVLSSSPGAGHQGELQAWCPQLHRQAGGLRAVQQCRTAAGAL